FRIPDCFECVGEWPSRCTLQDHFAGKCWATRREGEDHMVSMLRSYGRGCSARTVVEDEQGCSCHAHGAQGIRITRGDDTRPQPILLYFFNREIGRASC